MFTRPIYKTLIYITLPLISLISLTGCREDETINRQLDAAEPLAFYASDELLTYIKNVKCADSIFAVLSQSGTNSMSRRQRARYDLLGIELDYKHEKDTLDLSKIRNTREYFNTAQDRAYKMRALFLESICLYYMSEYVESTALALECEQLAADIHDTLYLAKIHNHIANINNHNGNINGCLKHSLASARFYERVGRHRNSIYNTIDYTLALKANREYRRCIEITDSLLNEVSPTDTATVIYIHESAIRALLSVDSVNSANKHLDMIMAYNAPHYIDYNIPFDVAVANKDLKAVRHYLDTIMRSDDAIYHHGVKMMAMYSYHKLAGCLDSALIYHERLYDADSRAMLQSINQSIVRAESDYNARKADHNAEIAHRNRIYLLLSIIILGMTTLTVYLYGRSRFHRKVIEMQEKIAQIRELFDAIEVKDNAIAGLHSQVSRKESELSALNTRLEMRESLLRRMTDKTSEIYRARFREIGDLLATYYQKKDASDRIRLSIYTDIENTMTALGSHESLDEIRQSLNLYNDNIITRFMADFPSLKKIDVNIFTFLVAGFKPAVIATICRLDIDNLYSRRRRLKEKITQSDAKSKSEYLRYL